MHSCPVSSSSFCRLGDSGASPRLCAAPQLSSDAALQQVVQRLIRDSGLSSSKSPESPRVSLVPRLDVELLDPEVNVGAQTCIREDHFQCLLTYLQVFRQPLGDSWRLLSSLRRASVLLRFFSFFLFSVAPPRPSAIDCSSTSGPMDRELISQGVGPVRSTHMDWNTAARLPTNCSKQPFIFGTCGVQVQEDVALLDSHALNFAHQITLIVVVDVLLDAQVAKTAQPWYTQVPKHTPGDWGGIPSAAGRRRTPRTTAAGRPSNAFATTCLWFHLSCFTRLTNPFWETPLLPYTSPTVPGPGTGPTRGQFSVSGSTSSAAPASRAEGFRHFDDWARSLCFSSAGSPHSGGLSADSDSPAGFLWQNGRIWPPLIGAAAWWRLPAGGGPLWGWGALPPIKLGGMTSREHTNLRCLSILPLLP